MTKEEHILAIVRGSRTEAESKARLREFLEPDYTPRGSSWLRPMLAEGIGDIGEIAPAESGMRCAAVIGEDIQSGRLYCGEPAHLYGRSRTHPKLCCVLCKQHARRHGLGLPGEDTGDDRS